MCLVTRLSCAFPVCSICLPAYRRDSSAGRGGSPGGRPAASGPVLTTCTEPWAGHGIALQGILDPSCHRIDLIYKAATQSRAENPSQGLEGLEGRGILLTRTKLEEDSQGKKHSVSFYRAVTKAPSVERTALQPYDLKEGPPSRDSGLLPVSKPIPGAGRLCRKSSLKPSRLDFELWLCQVPRVWPRASPHPSVCLVSTSAAERLVSNCCTSLSPSGFPTPFLQQHP